MTFQPAVRRMVPTIAIFLAIALTLFLAGPSGKGVSLAQANGQGGNSPATGLPTISGTVQVGETLMAGTSNIADDDGLEDVSFTYQWLADDADISGATGSTYTLANADEGKAVKVRLSFTDDADNEEMLTSGSTDAVAAVGARAQRLCSGGGYDPSPTEVEVEAVPIVVESTIDEYFVVYVRYDLDADSTVYLPVTVTLGQAGTTTLSENVAALPKERYQVHKYLVADPADVDGDCIDDITELADPVGQNPVNSAATLALSAGALAVPDRNTFEALSRQGTWGDHRADHWEFVKFFLFDMETDSPGVYFMNTSPTGEYLLHRDFMEAQGVDWDRAISGEIAYNPDLVAPGGSQGIYSYRLYPFNFSHEFTIQERSYRLLAASLPLVNDDLVLHIENDDLADSQADFPLYEDARINLVFDQDMYPEVEFQALNTGEGYGLLRVREPGDRPHPREIVVYEALPHELPRVAGIITTAPQTPLSHINLRAVQDGVPNAFILDALDNPDIDSLLDNYVHYTVTEGGWTLRAATPAEVDAHYAASRPATDQTPQRDLSVTEITALRDIEFDDWTAFGVKAANVAVLRTLGFRGRTVPDGFAVPFYFYDEFMKHNGFYDDIEELLADSEFQTNFDTQESELKKLRKKIKKGETPAWINTALTEMHAAYPEGQSLRYRSSTNNEDLPGFNGAGLYDSKTQHPEETEEDGIAKSLKQVFASLWNFRAFSERDFHRIDHLEAAMGVLVHPNYSDELANGVAVSFDPIVGRDDVYYVNTQLGEDLVTNPEAHSIPEEILLYPGAYYNVLGTSNQVAPGRLLLSANQLARLRRHLEVIHEDFKELYKPCSGEPFAMEIEFKITSENILAIKQARPWVFNVPSSASAGNSPAAGAPRISGTAQVGETLTANTSCIKDTGGLENATFSYQWRADGTAIQGATDASYTLVEVDEGKAIRVRVSFTDDAGNDETLTSSATAAVAARPNTPATGIPTISGPARVGETLTLETSGVADENGLGNVAFSYQWVSSDGSADTDIQEATTATYTLVADDIGKTIKARVSFTDDAGNEERLTSAPTAVVEANPNIPATGLPSITGAAKVGETLAVSTSGIQDDNGLSGVAFTYQWLADDTAIDGATGASLTLTPTEQGQTIRVRVSFTDDAGYTESLRSSSTATVQAASQCSGTGTGPTPTLIEVEAVPIVVESTIDEYFVVYVRYDLDADSTVYLPVTVTLGQAGTTTLSENVAALPKERYQVHKYLVADPADVDGDCIDDITELADPVGQNPVNSAATLALSAGALAVPDRDIFEALSRYGIYVKFFLVDMETDSPGVYFMNTSPTGEYLDHRDLMEAQGVDWDRAIRGEIAYNPDLIAPGGSQGIYSYRLDPFNFSYAFSLQERSYRLLAASLPLLNDDLALHIPNDELPYSQADFPLYEDARINLVFDEDRYPEVDFQALNTGEGYGLLRVREPDDRPHPREIVVYEALPHELPRVAGIITTAPQTPLSHINLRAIQDGVPNAFIRDALDNPGIDSLLDNYVHYTVTEGGWTLRAATPAEVDAHYAASRPATDQTPQRDLSVTEITALRDIEFDDWTAFGVKAANVAVLRTLGFRDGTVPDGFAVPFYFYDEFMKYNGFYDDIEELLADSEFQTDFDTQESKLKKLRKKIKKGDTPVWINTALTEMHAAYPEGQSLRYRSSTNNEDLPGFNGAGLYDSKTQHPEETEEDGIAKSLKQVFASLWNFRAFSERDFHRIDHLEAAMGVLVHPNYSDELANGVAVSFDPIVGRDDVYYVNTQLGEDLVTNPEAHSVPEEILLYHGDYYNVLGTSNQVPPGQLLLTTNQLARLRRHLEVIHEDFKRLYKPCSGEPFAMEIEFKITSENILAIKQARPWVFNVPSSASAGNSPATGAPRISGTAQVGETLTANTSCIKDTDGLENATFSYQWRADGTAIQGATDATYTLVEVDEGKAIRVRVSFTDDAGNNEMLTSAATGVVSATPQPNSPAAGAPTISGTAQAGETLTVSTSSVEDADGMNGAALSYQWVSSDGTTDTDIREATGATYTLVADDIGKTVTVRVKFTDDRGFEETLTSAPTAVVEASPNIPATGLPSITGAADVGETLTVSTSGIQDANGLSGATYSYQWVSNDGTADTDIEEVTSTTYTLVADDIGKTIKVRVSFTDDGGNEETLTSAPTSAVEAKLNIPATGLPTIRGRVQVGKTLTADTTGVADPNGLENATFGYQWLADGTAIDGATGRDYTLADADKGKAIKVRVTFTDDGGNEETLTSAATGPVLGDGLPGAPRNLTATPGNKEVTLSWDPPADNGNAPATRYRIEWRVDGKDYDKNHSGTSRSTTYMTNDQANLANGVKYFFRVKAGNGSGNSYGPYGPASGEVSATPTSGSAVDLGTPVLSDTENLHHGMVRLDWQDVEDAGWYVVQYYHLEGGEWLDLPAEGVDIAFHGSSAVVSNLHGLSWLRVGAASCDGASEWSQIEELYGTKESDWEGVPVPEVAEGDEIEPCPVVLGTPVLSEPEALHHGMVGLDWQDIEDAGWYVVQYYHLEGGEWLDLPAEGVDIAFHGSSAVVSNLHGLSWLRVGAASCDGASEWSQIEELYGTNASDWEGVPVPEVEEGDEIEPCSEDVDTSDNSSATGLPTISGTAQVGETLTANTSGIADADGLGNVQYEHQWLAGDAGIPGATNATYTLAAADEGKAIRVQVAFTDDAGNQETLTSAATDAVAAVPAANSPATGDPTISGTAQVGETLTADTSGIADADGLGNVQYEYQWLAGDAEIAGATGSTYTLVDADEGKAIKVEVSFTDDAGNDESLTSGATDAVAAAEPAEPPAKPRGLSATATHDQVVLTWNDPGDDSITGYVVLRRVRENDTGGEFSVLVPDTGSAAATYTDDTVAASTTYTYRIKAINGAGTSERSRWVHIDIPAAPVPDKPTGLSATAAHDSVTLTWNDPGDDSITGYVILRRLPGVDPEGQFSELVSNTGTAELTYTDDTVSAETRYTYRIKAINGAGPGERSRWYHIDTPAAP